MESSKLMLERQKSKVRIYGVGCIICRDENNDPDEWSVTRCGFTMRGLP